MDVMLVHDMGQVRSALERGEEVRPDEVGRLLSRVKTEAAQMDRQSVKLLKDEIDAIEALVRDAADGIAQELQLVQATREGHHGYAHLRRHKTGQRLYRKA